MLIKRLLLFVCLIVLSASCVFAAPAAQKGETKTKAFELPKMLKAVSLEPLLQKDGGKPTCQAAPLVKLDIKRPVAKEGFTQADIDRVVVDFRELAILFHLIAEKYRDPNFSNESLPAAALGEYEIRRRAALVQRGASFTVDDLIDVYNCHRSIRVKVRLVSYHFDRLANPENSFLNDLFVQSDGPPYLSVCREYAELFDSLDPVFVFLRGMSRNPYYEGYSLLAFSQRLNDYYITLDTIDGNPPTTENDYATATIHERTYQRGNWFLPPRGGSAVTWHAWCLAWADLYDEYSQSIVRRIEQLGARPPVLE